MYLVRMLMCGIEARNRKQEIDRQYRCVNRIYWDRDKISILTDQIEAIEQKERLHAAAFVFSDMAVDCTVGNVQDFRDLN